MGLPTQVSISALCRVVSADNRLRNSGLVSTAVLIPCIFLLRSKYGTKDGFPRTRTDAEQPYQLVISLSRPVLNLSRLAFSRCLPSSL